MDLQGRLDKIRLPDLIQMLATGEQEGVLIIRRGEDERRLRVTAEGRLMIHATFPEHTTLAKRLYEAGDILEQEYLNGLRRQSQKAQLFGEVVRSFKAVPGEVIDQALRLLLFDDFSQLFYWKDAEFKFHEGAEDRKQPFTELTVDPSSLIMEIARQHDELEEASSLNWLPNQVYLSAGAAPSDLARDEQAAKVLSALDGFRNVEGVATHAGISLADAAAALQRLKDKGLVRLATPDELYRNAEESRRRKQYIKSRWLLQDAAQREPSAKFLRKLAEYCDEDEAPDEAADAYLKLARLLLDSHDAVGAVESLHHLLEIDKDRTEARKLLCHIFIEGGNYLGAAREAETIEKSSGDLPAALECYQRLVGKNPADLASRLSMARLLAATGRHDESFEECKKLERVLPVGQQVDLLPVYERLVRSGRRTDEITTRIRHIRKLAASLLKKDKRGLPQRMLSALVFGLLAAFVIYQFAAQTRFTNARRQAQDLSLAGKHEDAYLLIKHLLNTSPFTPFRKTAMELADSYLEKWEQAKAKSAYTVAFADAQKLAGGGDLEGAIAQMQSYVQAFGTRAIPEAWAIIERLKSEKAGRLNLTAKSLRQQALELENAGLASKAIEVYDKLTNDQELSPFAGIAAERAQLLRQEVEKANAELAPALQLEKEGRIKDAHEAIAQVLGRYPSVRNDIPILLPSVIDSIPAGADVRVNGNPAGSTPYVVHYSPDSPVQISVTLPGFSPAELRLSSPGSWLKTLSLSKLPGWVFHSGGPVDTTPRLRNGTLYFGSRDTQVYAVASASGSQIWKHQIGSISEVTSSPAVTANSVIVGTVDGTVAALDAANGQPIWSFATRGYVRSGPEVLEAAQIGCVGSADGVIYGFEIPTGKIVWQVDAGSAVSANAARRANVAFYVSEKGKVLAIDIPSGSTLWSADTKPNALGIVRVGSVIVTAAATGEVIGLNADSGQAIWPGIARGRLKTPPAAAAGAVLVSTDLGEIVCFQANTGTELWRISIPEEAAAHLACEANLVIAATLTGKVFAIDSSTGALAWPASAGSSVNCAPLITPGGIYIASRDNSVYFYAP